jgi:hypothetical protein
MRERIREMCNDGAGVEEQAVQALYGCWRELYLAVYRMYDMTDDSWEPAGKFDACNAAKPFAKVVNSWFLVGYCLSDNYSQQWHSTEDYVSSISCYDNRFHGPFYTRFIQYDGSRPADTEVGVPLPATAPTCTVPVSTSATPSTRRPCGPRPSCTSHGTTGSMSTHSTRRIRCVTTVVNAIGITSMASAGSTSE